MVLTRQALLGIHQTAGYTISRLTGGEFDVSGSPGSPVSDSGVRRTFMLKYAPLQAA